MGWPQYATRNKGNRTLLKIIFYCRDNSRVAVVTSGLGARASNHALQFWHIPVHGPLFSSLRVLYSAHKFVFNDVSVLCQSHAAEITMMRLKNTLVHLTNLKQMPPKVFNLGMDLGVCPPQDNVYLHKYRVSGAFGIVAG